MTDNVKLGLGIGATIVLVSIIGHQIYKGSIKKIPDDLSVSFSNFDGKTVDYNLKRNGKQWSSGKIIWREDLVGKQGSDGISDGKNSFETRHLNGHKAYVYLESLDKKFPVGLIDFVKKTYTLA